MRVCFSRSFESIQWFEKITLVKPLNGFKGVFSLYSEGFYNFRDDIVVTSIATLNLKSAR